VCNPGEPNPTSSFVVQACSYTLLIHPRFWWKAESYWCRGKSWKILPTSILS